MFIIIAIVAYLIIGYLIARLLINAIIVKNEHLCEFLFLIYPTVMLFWPVIGVVKWWVIYKQMRKSYYHTSEEHDQFREHQYPPSSN